MTQPILLSLCGVLIGSAPTPSLPPRVIEQQPVAAHSVQTTRSVPVSAPRTALAESGAHLSLKPQNPLVKDAVASPAKKRDSQIIRQSRLQQKKTKRVQSRTRSKWWLLVPATFVGAVLLWWYWLRRAARVKGAHHPVIRIDSHLTQQAYASSMLVKSYRNPLPPPSLSFNQRLQRGIQRYRKRIAAESSVSSPKSVELEVQTNRAVASIPSLVDRQALISFWEAEREVQQEALAAMQDIDTHQAGSIAEQIKAYLAEIESVLRSLSE